MCIYIYIWMDGQTDVCTYVCMYGMMYRWREGGREERDVCSLISKFA